MVKVHVEPLVEAGLNRGGEDLSLVFSCEVEGETVPTEFVVHLNVDDDQDGCNVERLDKELESEWAEHDDQPYTGTVKYTTCHYEFEWQGTPEDALALVAERLKDAKNWRYAHKPGESPRLRFEYEHYVSGNAD